jgi:hypothetical protein
LRDDRADPEQQRSDNHGRSHHHFGSPSFVARGRSARGTRL